jgi:TPR repeat protein
MQWCQGAALDGQADAQCMFGRVLLMTHGKSQGAYDADEAAAVDMFRRAAEAGHLQASTYTFLDVDDSDDEHDLSARRRTHDGRGAPVPCAPSSLPSLTLREAADQGQADAQFQLGRLSLQGPRGWSPEAWEAAKWLTLAARQGHHGAQYELFAR